jgi:SAM-dependent methyltransferase
MKLNLGCGDNYREGWQNIDLFASKVDQRLDLNLDWPWADSSVDEIFSRGLYEHLKDFNHAWLESWRIVKPGGIITLIVPHFASPLEPWPGQHLHQFSLHTFRSSLQYQDRYCKNPPRFETIKLKHYFGYGLRWLNGPANIAPKWWEWLKLPTCEIEWKGQKPAN